MVLDKWMRRLIKAGRTRPYLRRLLVMLAAPLSECQICGGAHESESCPVTAAEALISALPSEELVAQWSDQQRQEHGIYAQLEAAYLAYDALTDSQKALLPGAEETLAGLFSAVSGPAMTMELANDWITEADVSWYTDPAHVSGDPYVISTAAQLAGLALIVNQGQGSNPPDTFANQTIQLAQDLDLSGKTWTPIGKNSYFAGIFDGQGHTIRGLDVPNSKMNYEGLFGDIRGQSADALCVIQDLAVEGSVQGNQYAGGIAATMKWATIERCASRVAVSGIEYLGGIVGQMEQTATIRNCYATGAIQGQNLLGGIAGHCKDWGADKANTIENCYATSAITATSSSPYAGGILGQGMGGFILKNCVALNPYIKSAGTEKLGGRVVDSAGPNVSGNYAREDMKLKPHTSDNTATSANGASIALGTEQSWNTWFDTTAAASVWSNYPVQALDSGAALPTLSAINLGAEEAPLLPMVVKTLMLSASTEQQIKVGDTLQLTATVDPQNAVVQWQSVDPGVATVVW